MLSWMQGRFMRMMSVKQGFTKHDDLVFPEEAIKLRGFRGQKVKLAKYFG
ncbi:hypothetical protein L915_15038 [Phytophthora nicotianae]|uniref:Uncharacterized protein n=2 Tax=Phytophthora nicotianae TaxID=4792 RepID=W2G825_PHYNI|nr:hypothetical protein L915_15038 [Phytophthora nicotianae]ETL32502.1 hypothetical protein L916_14935 [Phytophthora nicotianae]ETO67613.1 hypothetical protein F444_15482 [Phytophthora nicotianae P1976]